MNYETVRKMESEIMKAFENDNSRDIMDEIKTVLLSYLPCLEISVTLHGEFIRIGGRNFQPSGSLEYIEVQQEFKNKLVNFLYDKGLI